MTELINWIKAAPPNAIPVVTALLAAIVALVVMILTQWVLGRRARTDLLTKKLEELYVLVLKWLDDAAATKTTVDRLLESQPLSQEARATILSHVNQPRADRRASMYINMYFQRLNRFDEDVFRANQHFTKVVRQFGEGEKTTNVDIQRAYLKLWLLLQPLRDEILKNHAYLTRSRLFRPSYKQSSIGGSDGAEQFVGREPRERVLKMPD